MAEKCPECGAWWTWPSEHRCPPLMQCVEANHPGREHARTEVAWVNREPDLLAALSPSPGVGAVGREEGER